MSFGDQLDDPIILTLENSVIKAKKAFQPATSKITDTNKWTKAFTIYMSVLFHQFPGWAQELLAYISLMREGAQTHKGLRWCIYNHKFKCKAALNPTVNWSNIDQQLWLMIFTTSPDAFAQQYSIFSNGPQNQFSLGAARGLLNEYNRQRHCSQQFCQYRHVCYRCSGLPKTAATRGGGVPFKMLLETFRGKKELISKHS